MAIQAIGLDADDTLWHNEDGFHQAENLFSVSVAAWADEPTARARLLETEKRNVQVYGYGVKSFILSTIECGLELSDGRIGTEVINSLIEFGRWMLTRPTILLDGVEETVVRLRADYRLILITKGDPHHQLRKVTESGLEHLFHAVEVVQEKDPSVYRDALGRHGIEPSRFVMVGNSLRSDVLPIVELGGHGVHIPYAVTWGLEHADPAEVAGYIGTGRFHSLVSFGELPNLLNQLG